MIFVTGGTGLIGSHLLFQLVSAGKKVRALKRESSDTAKVLKTFSYYSGKPEELFHRIEWVNGDILDYFKLEKLLCNVEEVYHCAAVVSFSRKERKNMIHNNVEGTANMVNATLENGAKKFCHVSSVSALGPNLNGYATDELTNWVPSKKMTAYSQSKFFSETEIWRGIEEGLDAVIVNPSIVLGPGNWDSGSSQLFKTVYNGLKFYTKGVTGYVDVKDVVQAMILLMDDSHFESCKNQRFLLNSENLSYRDVFSRMANAMNKPRPKYFASKLMLAVAWRAASLVRMLSGGGPEITRETATAAGNVTRFDGSKITRATGFQYLPVFESISQTAAFLKRDMAG
jgi:nucleoside-diphosphate-sugar epimerase